MPRPSDHLAAQIHKLLRCAAPDALASVTDIVVRAYDEGMSDAEVLNMLCERFRCGRDGWPIDPHERVVQRIKRFFGVNDPKSETRMSYLVKRCTSANEQMIMSDLYAEYGVNEHGEPTDRDAFIEQQLNYIFRRCAPDLIGEIGRYVSRFREVGADRDPEAFLDLVCSEFGVGRDGWPGHPAARRRARLTRFFLTNKPEDLRKVDSLVSVKLSEAEVLAELYSVYGKNEVGEPVRAVAQLRRRLQAVLEVAAPEKLSALSTIVAYGERNSLSDDQVIQLVTQQLDVGDDGWPTDPEKRIRARVERFFMKNAPNDLAKASRLLSLTGVSEDEIMNQLYKKYGVDEFGCAVNIEGLADELEDRIAQFYEQYVPEAEVDALTKQALGLKLPEADLFALLQQRYKGHKPVEHELRKQIKTIFRRCGDQAYESQTRTIMLLRRREKLSDKDVLAAVCDKYGVGADGWPTDAVKRRTLRLTMFFKNNDASRLPEIKSLVESIGDASKAESAFFGRLIKEYGRDELGDLIEEAAALALLSQADEQSEHAASELLPEGADTQADMFPDISVNNASRMFVPGMSQVWPPPDLSSAEALYRSELFAQLIRKYGGTRVSFDTHSDAFSRLSRQFDDGPENFDVASPPRKHKTVGIVQPLSEADLHMQGLKGSTSCTSLQHGALPNASNAVRNLTCMVDQTIKQCQEDRQRAAQRVAQGLPSMPAEFEPASRPSSRPSRASYRVAVPDSLPNGSVVAPQVVAQVARTTAEIIESRLPLRLQEQVAPRWISDDEKLLSMYPLATASAPCLPAYGTRPPANRHY